MIDHSNLDAALSFARRGWPVFALDFKKDHSGKWKPHPTTSQKTNGKRWGATTDRDEICRRWENNPTLGIGIATGPESELLVLDIDTEAGHGKNGPASLRTLEAEHDPLPNTVEVCTPSGGRHLYFKYPHRKVGIDAGKVGPGLDHRGDGGYVVAAPTIRQDGEYSWARSPEDCEIADAPEWLIDLMAQQRPQEAPPAEVSEPSNRWAEAALTDETTKLWATPKGQRNHALNAAAFSLGQIIAGGGLERATVETELRSAAEETGLHVDEISKTIKSGIEAGLKEPRHPPKQSSVEEGFTTPNDFHGWSFTDPASIPKTKFLFSDFYAAGYTSLTVAAPKVGKSLLAATEAVDAAVGGSILLDELAQRRRVLYYCAEDDQNTINARVCAICEAHSIEQSDLEGQLWAVSGINRDNFFLASGDDATINEKLFEWLQDFVTENEIEIVILDPLQDLTTCPETNEVFRKIGQRLRAFANATSCAVHLVHHTRKMMAGSTPGIDDARGGGALRGTSRFNRVLVPMTEAEGVEAGVDEHWRYFRVGDAESNLAPPTANSNKWFKKATVEIADGHFQPAIMRWSWPGPMAGLPFDAVRKVIGIATDAEMSGSPLRQSAQAQQWGGYRIAKELGITPDKTGKAKIKRLLEKMVQDGTLQRATSDKNDKGKTPPILIAPCSPQETLETYNFEDFV
ncbi:MAG: bifunctional DNA primase/polymerase [Paracoccaceae bacterium]|nr:bifunctional DNA primase/polymerase [Paracoccaceae bacterium]MDG2258352.1 bifunctional DNA primase/polymerase [Paracoccaceae bacterium]